jgi:DNA repair protein RecO (recombination protein O)
MTMPLEKAHALVIRTTDWSESSRIATLWTREFGKARALAKGGRRLKSNFESALDLLSVCDIVLLRKTSGSLDLLTEARVRERFAALRHDLQALYAAYYVAEMLSDWTEDHDPHPALFDEALATLRTLGQPEVLAGPRLARFELVLLRELGYGPTLEACAGCATDIAPRGLAFSAAAGGVVCPACQARHKDRRPLSPAAWQALRTLRELDDGWRTVQDVVVRAEVRQVLNDYETYAQGRRPRLLPYLGS